MFDNGNDTDSNQKPSFEERYEAATNTSDLSHEADKRGASDVLRDMAMTADRIGGALLRLKSQWSAASKPERMPVHNLKHFLAIHHGDAAAASKAQRAEAAESEASYQGALATLASRLPDLAMVRDELMPVALRYGMGAPDPAEVSNRRQKQQADDERTKLLEAEVKEQEADDDKQLAQATLNLHIIQMRRRQAGELAQDRARAHPKIGEVIRYWVQERCPRCDGLKFLVAPGTARLSKNMCPPVSQGGCGGTGYLPAPHGQMGRKLANHMDSLAHRYRKSGNNRKQQLAALPRPERLLQGQDESD